MVKAGKNIILEGGGLGNLQEIASKLLDLSDNYKIWLFDGEMGAGKTTLIKEICNLLGVGEVVSSPTFSIINEYLSTKGSIYHFDFYRIMDLEEAMQAGVEEYFFSGDYCFIEWPEVILPIIPSKYLKISIEVGEGEARRYKLTHYGID